MKKVCTFVPHLFLTPKNKQSMKQMFLPVLVFVYAGNFKDTDAAVNSVIPGFGANLDEKEDGLHFPDYNGNPAVAKEGDALIVRHNDDGTPHGFEVLPASIVAMLVEPAANVAPAATANADAADANTGGTATS